MGKAPTIFHQPDTLPFRLLSLTAISGEFPHQPAQPPSRQSLLLGGGRDCAQKRPDCCAPTTRTGSGAIGWGSKPSQFCWTDGPSVLHSALQETQKPTAQKRSKTGGFRLHRLAETYITIGNAGVLLYPDEKPKVFAQTGFGGEAVTYPVFYSSREVKGVGG